MDLILRFDRVSSRQGAPSLLKFACCTCRKIVSTRAGHIPYWQSLFGQTGLGQYPAISTEQSWPITPTHRNCPVFFIVFIIDVLVCQAPLCFSHAQWTSKPQRAGSLMCGTTT